MWFTNVNLAALLLALGSITDAVAVSASCAASPVASSVPAPSVASGYHAKLMATGLRSPRGIAFDARGHLLVVEAGHGVTALTLNDQGGDCVSVTSKSVVVNDASRPVAVISENLPHLSIPTNTQDVKLNHGIALNRANSNLFVSSADTAYSYPYSAASATISGPVPGAVIVRDMSGTDHTTRTLLFSKFSAHTLVINRGSTENIDSGAIDKTSGHSQIKAFNITHARAVKGVSHTKAGRLLGWGLRNDVGIAEHPITGGIWSVENSVDELMRSGINIRDQNPGEKLNFLGYINASSIPKGAYGSNNVNRGANFGYPQCFAAWNASAVPDYPGLQTGQQFAIGGQSFPTNDSYCKNKVVAPRLVFDAHMAPLDIKFNRGGSAAWVSFHGSFDRAVPQGYKVSIVPFKAASGEPVAPANSNTGYIDIVSNADTARCPTNCFRPVGLAFDSVGRLWFSSDATGEVYMITKDAAANGSVG